MRHLRSSIVTVAAALAAGAFAQPATPAESGEFAGRPGYGIFRFQTRLGSLRFINGEGRLEFGFTGTLLINKLDGNHQVSGKLRKEWDKNDRIVYTGTGRVVVTGKWRAVQWFGSDLSGQMYGKGWVRLSGEFDRNLNTGEHWGEDPSIRNPWPAGTTVDFPIPVVRPGVNPNVQPRRRP